MKHSIKIIAATFCTVFMSVGFVGQASAGVILSAPACSVSHVTAGAGPTNANLCIGLIAKSGSGNPKPNDSPGLFNNPLTTTDSTVLWASGAFGINTWAFLGKDEEPNDPGNYNFINFTNGAPGSWVVDSALGNFPYLLVAKQSTNIGLYYFASLSGITSGTADIASIFGEGKTGTDGWSHFSIYTTTDNPTTPFPSVPEPGVLGLLGLGLLGLALTRRRLRVQSS